MRPDRRRTLHVLWTCAVTVLMAATRASAAEYLVNGHFEDGEAPLAGWTIETDHAAIRANRTRGEWIPVKVTFKTGANSKEHINIGAYGTPSGRCWMDNVRPEGFTVANRSFEESRGQGTILASRFAMVVNRQSSGKSRLRSKRWRRTRERS